MGDWLEKAKDDAKSAANYFEDEIVEALLSAKGETKKTDISNYGHNYSIGDDFYGLKEAADLLDDLSRYESEDEGMWRGLAPRDAISAMAGETYRNAVQANFRELMDDINSRMDAPEIMWDFDEWLEEAKGKKGVLDWSPEVEDPDEFREGAEKIYAERLKDTVKDAVRTAIDNW